MTLGSSCAGFVRKKVVAMVARASMGRGQRQSGRLDASSGERRRREIG
jgi:hypothetical protein